MTGDGRKEVADDKFAPNWQGHYRVRQSLDNDALRLEHLDGEKLPRTWNANHLKFYFS